MRLVASLITRNEMKRYLEPCVESLLAFVDEIRVLDDRSEDGTAEWLAEQAGVKVLINEGEPMFQHEGFARQRLLNWTLEAAPTHILSVDADEIVADGKMVREAIVNNPGVQAFTLLMEEIWKTCPQELCVRHDGGWRPHEIPILYAVPPPGFQDRRFHISPKQLACGREPVMIRNLAVRGKAIPTGTEVLHFGWSKESARQARYDRYVEADGGRFHASSHLQSIMWPDDNVTMVSREWPATIDKEKIMEVSYEPEGEETGGDLLQG